MHELEARFGHWVIAARWWIIIGTLLLVAAAASGARHLTFTNNYRVFFSAENPELLAFEALENTYAKSDNVLFVLVPADGDVFTPRVLEAVATLTEGAWQIPYSTRVDSVTNFQHTYAEGDELIVRDLVPDPRHTEPAQLDRIRATALAEPLLVHRLVSPDAHATGVNVTIQLPGIDPTREVPEVVAFARRLAADLRVAYPDVDLRLTGMVLMNNAFSEASIGDLQTLVPLSFGLMVLMLALLLRSITATLVTLIVIALSIVTALGLGGHGGVTLTPPSVISPTVILTVAVANSVHILVTFLQEMHRGAARQAALVSSLRVNLQPVFLTSLTTTLGFLSLNFSDVPPFNDLGNLVAMGVVASFVLAVTFLPALISLLPVRGHAGRVSADPLMARVGDFVVRRRRVLLWAMAAVVGTVVVFIPRNELNDVFVHYFDERVAFRRDADFTTEQLTGLYQIEYSLRAGEAGGISEPDFLRQVAAFAQWYRQQPETVHVNAITDILMRLNKNMHSDDPAWHRLPEQRELAAQYLLLYEMSLPYGLDLNNQINVDKSATRLSVTTRTLSTNAMLALEARAQDWLAEHAPDITQAEASGPSFMFAHIGKRNIISMLYGTTAALAMISLLLVIALRSVRIGLTSMIPNLVPAAMGFGLWGMFVGEVGLALSVVTGMTLGIVVDDTVHFLSKYLRGRREQGLGPEDAVRYAFVAVGRALTVTSLVLVTGFLILALSSFHLNAGMGLLTAMVIALALAADFLLLPPLLMKIEEKTHAEMVASERTADPVTT